MVHGLDHFRRGFDALTAQVYWAGQIPSALGLIAIALVLFRHYLAPWVAVLVGFPMALGVAASHLLPRWRSLSEAFPSSAVDALSYAAVLTEIAGALALGVAGACVLLVSGRLPIDPRGPLAAR
ncbi:MAG TPA: hypothetical protein VGI47_03350 [Candidatus Binataceae bacterium]